jgi:hypothetical protein
MPELSVTDKINRKKQYKHEEIEKQSQQLGLIEIYRILNL